MLSYVQYDPIVVVYAMQADSRVTSQGLPKFIPDASNVALIFNHWLDQFKVELALIAARAGKNPGKDPVDIYNDHLKASELVLCYWPNRGIRSWKPRGMIRMTL